ncbi:MAG: SprT-like domain-containing protein [Gammaproteobacteria bacterium]|nr:SprT-like domain-containing protein [Gammaproteobacteria bacterium]
MIEPIGAAEQAIVVDLTADYVARAESIFQREFAAVEVRFDLPGGSAGMFKVHGKSCWIRYNAWLFAKYFDDNLSGTVPHEVAHYIIHCVFGMRRIRPHGQQWLALMHKFDADPTVTSDFDLSGIPQHRQRRFAYRCDCRTHKLSTRRHYTVLRGKGQYQCVKCKGDLSAVQAD